MQLDRLQLDLRPRPHWEAIDLGFALLRHCGGTAYAAWLALWLPLCALCCSLALWVAPQYGYGWMLLAWWLRPLLERVVIFVLSRAVFGEHVSWLAALRAWPSQCRRGWFRLLTWWRPFMPGRGLYQPIWQLEQATGRFAADRRGLIGRDGAGRSAFWFGTVCAHFEVVLQLGVIALIGIFFAKPDAINPFALLVSLDEAQSTWLLIFSFAIYALAGGIIGPIYTAGTFTLYLNRRAELEAWDIEIAFRQLPKRPASGLAKPAPLLLMLLVGTLALQPDQAYADECAPPEHIVKLPKERGKASSPEQAKLREQLDQLYADPDLRGYRCINTWERRKPAEPEATKPSSLPNVSLPAWLPDFFKFLLIASAICVVAILLYRYRGPLRELWQKVRPSTLPDEVAGLDIRPETLPDDVTARVRELWQLGEQRAALALLYRATLSRLAHRHALALSRGATEGDCLIAATQAQRTGQLSASVLANLASLTGIWLSAAYAHRLPDHATLDSVCSNWDRDFAEGQA